MILEVRIKAPRGGTNRTLRFSKSPVRVGRNQLNDISIEDPFVSEWHGTIRFDQTSIAYFDLGSTNGTLLDGKRLVKNVAAELSDDSRLQLGLLELFVSRPLEQAPATRSAGTGPTGTMEWNRADLGIGIGSVGSVGNVGNVGNVGSSAPLAVGQPSTTATPTPAGRSLPVSSPPDTESPPGTGRPSEPHRNEEDADLFLRQRKLLEAFAEAFIGLRKGYEQFGAEVGVRTINGSTTLHRARSRSELLEYLLKPNADVGAIARDLIAIFADFGIHHIAMMQGVTEGARATLQSLNPRANDIDAGGRLFAGAKTKNQWKTYLERFDQTITDDNELHAALFGNEFARAYASVTLGEGGKAQDPEDNEDAG